MWGVAHNPMARLLCGHESAQAQRVWMVRNTAASPHLATCPILQPDESSNRVQHHQSNSLFGYGSKHLQKSGVW